MSYPVNPNDPTTPTDQQGARQGAEEFRALKALIASLVIAASSTASARQSIQSATLDANGYNTAITPGVGLRPGLTASVTDAYQLSFANGFSSGRAIDNAESITANIADILGADLPTSNTSYLYRTYGASYGSGLIPPDYGYAFDKGRGALLNFQGLNGAVSTTDDFGTTWTFTGNARIDTAQFKFGTSSLLLDGTGDYISTLGITTLGDSSWEVSMWVRFNVLPTAGQEMILCNGFSNTLYRPLILALFNNAGTTKAELYASSDGANNDILAGVVGTKTAWAINTWYRFRIVRDSLGGTYRLYVSDNGALETQEITVSTALKLANITTFFIGHANAGGGFVDFNGWIGSFRILRGATATAVQVPAVAMPTITDYKHHFFSIPKMQMFEVTAASLVAGTNPTLIAANILYLGEADTSGVAVIAVRNYAIRGQYKSALTTWANNSRTSFTHNTGYLGIHLNVQFKLVNIFADVNYSSGDTVTLSTEDNATNSMGYTVDSKTGLSISMGPGMPVVANKTTLVRAGLTPASWKMLAIANRDW